MKYGRLIALSACKLAFDYPFWRTLSWCRLIWPQLAWNLSKTSVVEFIPRGVLQGRNPQENFVVSSTAALRFRKEEPSKYKLPIACCFLDFMICVRRLGFVNVAVRGCGIFVKLFHSIFVKHRQRSSSGPWHSSPAYFKNLVHSAIWTRYRIIARQSKPGSTERHICWAECLLYSLIKRRLWLSTANLFPPKDTVR